jgi:hypothetical protein
LVIFYQATYTVCHIRQDREIKQPAVHVPQENGDEMVDRLLAK